MASSKVASALAVIIIQGTDASFRNIQQEKSIKYFALILQGNKRFRVQIIQCGMDFHETSVAFSVFCSLFSLCDRKILSEVPTLIYLIRFYPLRGTRGGAAFINETQF